MPGLQKRSLVFFYDTANLPEFMLRKTNVSGEPGGLQPEFGGSLIPIYVYVWRLSSFVAIPVKAIRAFSQDRGHNAYPAALAKFPMLVC
jgi:hypothetical protein